ncbi:hypothetical protein LINGRAHAP2_LOCUS613 [Linum grandiflorum]
MSCNFQWTRESTPCSTCRR